MPWFFGGFLLPLTSSCSPRRGIWNTSYVRWTWTTQVWCDGRFLRSLKLTAKAPELVPFYGTFVRFRECRFRVVVFKLFQKSQVFLHGKRFENPGIPVASWVGRVSFKGYVLMISYFHPYIYLGRLPSNLTCAYFSDGLVQPPTRIFAENPRFRMFFCGGWIVFIRWLGQRDATFHLVLYGS